MTITKRKSGARSPKPMDPAALARIHEMMDRMEREQASIRSALERALARTGAIERAVTGATEPHPCHDISAEGPRS